MRDTKNIPPRYNAREYEGIWQKKWEEWGVHKFDRKDRVKPTYSIDTPPPYPSGEFHMGNALNWCYFDFAARYKRMRGFNVHFPQGWDCHGLPTEVRAETTYNISKRDLTLAEFKDLCTKLTLDYIENMKKSMKSIGYSIDWSLEYRTMDPSYYRLTQLSFILLYEKERLYRGEHPVNWCPRCETAIAEAEVEYVEKEGSLTYIEFKVDGGPLIVATTRPELLPACVAVAVHPEDDRYRKFVGKDVEIPLFNRKVKLLEDEEVDRKFGSGVVMICTFGDKTDAKWQKRHNLPTINVLTENGKMTDDTGEYGGLTVGECRRRIREDLSTHGLIEKEEKLTRSVGTCWRCHTPIEILSRTQWFMRTREMTDDVIDWTNKITWIPAFSKTRMVDWASSLDWDWVISRQRIFATPIPVWYCKECGFELVAEEDWLPVDPRFDKPKSGRCRKCGGEELVGENDVMDTWMDSSITCAFHAGWPSDEEGFKRLFPASLQPNGLDIVRTWDYYLMVKHLALFDMPPYKVVLVNGMVRGADGRMMHKSYGNYVEASEVIENRNYGADALRQWAAGGGATGYDIPFNWSDIEFGRKFMTKLWNASRFTLKNLGRPVRKKGELELLDRWILSHLQRTIEKVTEAYEDFQFNVAIDTIRNFTWHLFCDQYLEAVKYRLYSKSSKEEASKRAAQQTLRLVLDRLIKLLTPICPHLSETIFQLMRRSRDPKSIHLAEWPSVDKSLIDGEAESEGEIIVSLISSIRRGKSERRIPLKEPVEGLTIKIAREWRSVLEQNLQVVRRICNIEEVDVENLPVDVTEGFEIGFKEQK